MAELGSIEKPSPESFTGKRKLYCVPNMYHPADVPEEFSNLIRKFWDEVTNQIERLELAGKIAKIFCENIPLEGEEALAVLEKMNAQAHQIVKKKITEGASLVPIEREDLLGPFIDWRNCLTVVRTEEVANKILEFYKDIADRRFKFIQHAIESNLGIGEAGLLIMQDEDRVKLQLPQDIEIFLVTPPSYDDILRWLRDRLRDLQA
ncbi:MAG: hypothetical protein ACM34I_06205 [bacterium]